MSTLSEDAAAPAGAEGVWASTALRDSLTSGTAPSLLLTILGELVLPLNAPVWTSALLYLLKGLGIEEQTARQTIARTADSGLIVGEKSGRLVRWSLSDTGVELIEETTRRVRSLSNPPDRWDGLCLILAVSVPQEQKAVRKRLYSALSWSGFGNPAPGIWASPHVDREEEMRQIIKDFDLRSSSFAFLGRTVDAGLTDAEIVERAWDLDGVAERYEKLISTFTGLNPSPGDDLLFTYIALANEWRQFPSMDPQLPRDLLPDWVGHRATTMFVDLYTRWSAGALSRWREISTLTSSDK
jgi:phenylacetic acid degradation operon negative regulatory protein